jgi:hypothetical protein
MILFEHTEKQFLDSSSYSVPTSHGENHPNSAGKRTDFSPKIWTGVYPFFKTLQDPSSSGASARFAILIRMNVRPFFLPTLLQNGNTTRVVTLSALHFTVEHLDALCIRPSNFPTVK